MHGKITDITAGVWMIESWFNLSLSGKALNICILLEELLSL